MSAAEARVPVLLALMRQLQEVMRTENQLLRDLKLARLQELQAEKSALAASYELELRRLRASPELVSGLDPSGRALLEASMRDLQATVRANAERLLHARGIVEAVVQTIGQSPGTAPAATRNYAEGARAAEARSGRVIPIALDRRC